MEPADKILTGAAELFDKYGLKSITMDDIAKHIGMSKKTIYQFFDDKEAIIQAVMDFVLKENQSNIILKQQQAENRVDEMFQAMRQMECILSHRNPVLFYDMQKYYPSVWHQFQEFKSNFLLKMTEKTLVRGIEQHLFRKDLNIGALARLRIAEIDLGFNPTIFPPELYHVSQVQQLLLEHFLYGICTIEGFKLIENYKAIAND